MKTFPIFRCVRNVFLLLSLLVSGCVTPKLVKDCTSSCVSNTMSITTGSGGRMEVFLVPVPASVTTKGQVLNCPNDPCASVEMFAAPPCCHTAPRWKPCYPCRDTDPKPWLFRQPYKETS